MDMTEKSFGAHVQAVFSQNWHCVRSFPLCLSRCLTSPGCATWALLLAWFYPLLFWRLHRNASCGPNTVVPVSHVCLEMPRAAVEQFPRQRSRKFFFFLNPQQKPRNLYQLIQLLALVLKAEVQWCAGQIASARRYCAVVCFGSTDAIYSCWAFWCHQFPGMKSWPCACKWKISIRFSEMGSPSKSPLWTELAINALLCVQDGIWLRWK